MDNRGKRKMPGESSAPQEAALEGAPAPEEGALEGAPAPERLTLSKPFKRLISLSFASSRTGTAYLPGALLRTKPPVFRLTPATGTSLMVTGISFSCNRKHLPKLWWHQGERPNWGQVQSLTPKIRMPSYCTNLFYAILSPCSRLCIVDTACLASALVMSGLVSDVHTIDLRAKGFMTYMFALPLFISPLVPRHT